MLARFLDYVEIKTKITSLFAFLLSIGYLLYSGVSIRWQLTGIFFASMFLFDLTTTAINNYIDTKTNAQNLQFGRKTALAIIYVLFTISASLGIFLAWQTDIMILLAGFFCFACGVLYTWGPLPISRLPLGEFFSGLFYGLLIPFILFYLNMPQGSLLTLSLSLEKVSLSLAVRPVCSLILLSAAPFFCTANIMLANNICDLNHDITVKRHTLPYYLGKKAITLFVFNYYAVYAVAILLVVFKILPWPYLAIFLTLLPVQKNCNTFRAKQIKSETFIVSIKNYVIIMATDVALVFACAFLL